jgi:hypothetical protein
MAIKCCARKVLCGGTIALSRANLIEVLIRWGTNQSQVVHYTHFWNVVVLAECLEFRVKLVDAVLVRLSSQFFHLIGKLHGTHKYKT